MKPIEASTAGAASAGVLVAGAAELGVALTDLQVERLIAFRDLLVRWNASFNLTAVRDPDAMVVQHLLDCLAIVPALHRQGLLESGGRMLDVGSGGGLPGVVLAVAQPSWQVTCVDAVGKKAAFVQQAAGVLGLDNLRSEHRRVEQLVGQFKVITARAFASLAELVRATQARLTLEAVGWR